MVAPANIIEEAIKMRRSINLRGDFIMEEALSAIIRSGDISRHIKKSIKIYQNRRDHLCTLMKEHLLGFLEFNIPAGGMAVWVKFNKAHPVQKIALSVAKQGLLMSDGNKYNTHKENYNAIRLGFASLNNIEITEVVRILKDYFQQA